MRAPHPSPTPHPGAQAVPAAGAGARMSPSGRQSSVRKRLRRGARADQVPVAVGLVDTPDRRPVLGPAVHAGRVGRLFGVVRVLPLSVGSIMNVPATGNDIVGAWNP